MSEWFRGTAALLRHRRRLFTRGGVVAGLIPGALLGLALTLGGTPVPKDVFLVYGLISCLACVAAPLAAGGPITFLTLDARGPDRRADLLALPTGRLALPAAVTLGGAGFLASFLLLLALGLALTVGPDRVWDGLLGSGPRDVLSGGLGQALLIGACLFTYTNAAVCLGKSSALLVLLIPGAVGLVAICIPGMGYDAVTQRRFLTLQVAVLLPYTLLLPFGLYARGRHHWAEAPGAEHGAADPVALLTALTAFTALGVFGWGPAAAVTAVGAAWAAALHVRRVRTARPRTSHLRVAAAAGVLALIPGAAVALLADAREVAGVVEQPAPFVEQVTVAPGERWAAVTVVPARANAAARVQVVDLTGTSPPTVLAPRFARTAGWSADGRYLAVHDLGVGRLSLADAAFYQWRKARWDRVAEAAVRALLRTLVFDTETGETTVLPLSVVAPGWTRPDDLIQVEQAWDGSWRFGRGGDWAILPALGPVWITVTGYLDGTPLITAQTARAREEWRWSPEGLLPAPPEAVAPAVDDWSILDLPPPADDGEEADPPARGGQTIEVRRGGAAHRLDRVRWTDDRLTNAGELLLLRERSLLRLDLTSGALTPVLEAGRSGTVVVEATGAGPWLLVRRGGDWYRFDRRDASLTPTTLGPVTRPNLFSDGRLHGPTADRGYAVERPDGAFVSIVGLRPRG